jgi:hypothetical protein
MSNIVTKKRNPALVIIFSIITLGIYLIYWFVKTKEEMKSLGADIPSAWLLIVPIGNCYLLYKYCDGFSEYVKKDKNGVLWFLVAVTVFPVIPVIVQIELNKLA